MTPHRSVEILGKRGGVVTKIVMALLAALLLASSLIPSLAQPAKAQEARPEGLTKVGPVNPESGYPFWYEDANGERLELCLDPQDQMCLQPFESPDPASPVSLTASTASVS